MTPKMGQRLRDRRVELGWSLRDLQERSGVDNGAIHRIETGGNVNPSIDKLQALATALDVSLVGLLVDDGQIDLPDLRTYLGLLYREIDDGTIGRLERQLSTTLRKVGLASNEET